MINRVGSANVLLTNQICVSLLPLLWLFARPDFLLPIWADGVLSGLFWPGFGLAQFNLTMHLAPARNRSAYFAVQSVVAGGAGFVAAMLGGALAYALSGWTWNARGVSLCNYHVLFVLRPIFRLLLIPLSRSLRVAMDQSRRLGETVASEVTSSTSEL